MTRRRIIHAVDEPIEFFEGKLQALASQQNVMKAFCSGNICIAYSSYVASKQIEKKKKAYTIGEKLILLIMKKVEKIMVEKEKIKD